MAGHRFDPRLLCLGFLKMAAYCHLIQGGQALSTEDAQRLQLLPSSHIPRRVLPSAAAVVIS